MKNDTAPPPDGDPTSRQVSGYAPDGSAVLSVITKRTYTLNLNGRLTKAAQQLPVVAEPVLDDDGAELLEDSDLYPWKPLTDVVVRGHAYNDRPAFEYQVGIGVGDGGKTLAVRGSRRCQRLANRGLTFTPAEPVDKVALSYKNAFGGRDKAAEAKNGTHLDELAKYMPSVDLRAASPYIYPRNPIGVGYVVEETAETFDDFVLPMLEDPEHFLTPERLIAGSPERCAAMPLPWSTGWMDVAAFPRAAYLGAFPQMDPATLPLAEIKRGFAANNLLKPGGIMDQFDFRLTNGGALGLQFPFLLPGAAMFLGGLQRTVPRLRFTLPAEEPGALDRWPQRQAGEDQIGDSHGADRAGRSPRCDYLARCRPGVAALRRRGAHADAVQGAVVATTRATALNEAPEALRPERHCARTSPLPVHPCAT
jgi:hypothetical protein